MAVCHFMVAPRMAAPRMEKGYGNLCQKRPVKGMWKPLPNKGLETSLRDAVEKFSKGYGNLALFWRSRKHILVSKC